MSGAAASADDLLQVSGLASLSNGSFEEVLYSQNAYDDLPQRCGDVNEDGHRRAFCNTENLKQIEFLVAKQASFYGA